MQVVQDYQGRERELNELKRALDDTGVTTLCGKEFASFQSLIVEMCERTPAGLLSQVQAFERRSDIFH